MPISLNCCMRRKYDVDEKGRRYHQLDDFMLALRNVTHCERSYSCSITVPIDMTEALVLKEKMKEDKNKRVTITAMIAKAAAIALEDFPILAGRWIDRIDRIYCPKKREIELFCPVQVGDFAGSTFMENVNMKSLIEIAEELNERVEKIKANVAVNAEAQIFPMKPFFAISNVGTIGCVESCNAQLTGDVVSELAVCSIIDKVVVKDNRVKIRKIMNCVLIWDHHAVLANTPIEFMMKMKKYLEEPGSYLMQKEKK